VFAPVRGPDGGHANLQVGGQLSPGWWPSEFLVGGHRPVVFLIPVLSEEDPSVRFADVCMQQQPAGEVLW